MFPYLLRDELVERLHGARGDAPEEVVDHSRLVQLVRVEEHVRQVELWALDGVLAVHALEGGLEEAVAEPANNGEVNKQNKKES